MYVAFNIVNGKKFYLHDDGMKWFKNGAKQYSKNDIYKDGKKLRLKPTLAGFIVDKRKTMEVELYINN